MLPLGSALFRCQSRRRCRHLCQLQLVSLTKIHLILTKKSCLPILLTIWIALSFMQSLRIYYVINQWISWMCIDHRHRAYRQWIPSSLGCPVNWFALSKLLLSSFVVTSIASTCHLCVYSDSTTLHPFLRVAMQLWTIFLCRTHRATPPRNVHPYPPPIIMHSLLSQEFTLNAIDAPSKWSSRTLSKFATHLTKTFV